jgi:hypothetical protein
VVIGRGACRRLGVSALLAVAAVLAARLWLG